MLSSVLCFCAVVSSLPFIDATKLKLIPNGFQRTHKDGVTHQISKFLIVPEQNSYEAKNNAQLLELKNADDVLENSGNPESTKDDSEFDRNLKFVDDKNHRRLHHHYTETKTYATGGGKTFVTTNSNKGQGLEFEDLELPQKIVYQSSYQAIPDETRIDLDELSSSRKKNLNSIENLKLRQSPYRTVQRNSHRIYEYGESGQGSPESQNLRDGLTIVGVNNEFVKSDQIPSTTITRMTQHRYETNGIGNEDLNESYSSSDGDLISSENTKLPVELIMDSPNLYETDSIGIKDVLESQSHNGDLISELNNEYVKSRQIPLKTTIHTSQNKYETVIGNNYGSELSLQSLTNDVLENKDITKDLSENHDNIFLSSNDPDGSSDWKNDGSSITRAENINMTAEENASDLIPGNIATTEEQNRGENKQNMTFRSSVFLSSDDDKQLNVPAESVTTDVHGSKVQNVNEKNLTSDDAILRISDNHGTFMTTDFDSSYPELESETSKIIGENEIYSEFVHTSLLGDKQRFNSLDYTWKPDVVEFQTQAKGGVDRGHARTDYDYFYLDDRPHFDDSDYDRKLDTLEDNVENINTDYVPIPSDIKFDNLNARLNSYEAEKYPENKSRFVIYPIPNINTKSYGANYNDRFVAINDKTPAIDDRVLKYILSQSKLPAVVQNAHHYAKINGELYQLSNTDLKYIISLKKLNSLNSQNTNNFLIIDGKRYAVNDDIINYILAHKNSASNISNKYVNFHTLPTSDKLDLAYRYIIKQGGSVLINDKNDRNKYILTKTPGYGIHVRFIGTPDTQDDAEMYKIQDYLNRLYKYQSKYVFHVSNVKGNSVINNNYKNNVESADQFKITYKMLVQQKYNLADLKLFLWNINKQCKADSMLDVDLIYDNILNYIAFLDSRGVSKPGIDFMIRKIKKQILSSIKVIILQRMNPYVYVNPD